MTKKKVPTFGKASVSDLSDEKFIVSYGPGGSDRKQRTFSINQEEHALKFYAEQLAMQQIPRLWVKQEVEFVARIKK